MLKAQQITRHVLEQYDNSAFKNIKQANCSKFFIFASQVAKVC